MVIDLPGVVEEEMVVIDTRYELVESHYAKFCFLPSRVESCEDVQVKMVEHLHQVKVLGAPLSLKNVKDS